LKIILGLTIKINQMKVYNALTGDWQMFKFARNPKCTVCHGKEVK